MEELSGVSKTLLVPLCARYVESKRTDGFLHDEKTIEIVESLGCACSAYLRSRTVQAGIAVRTEIFDKQVAKFLAAHERTVVVNLGAGLCTRFSRLDDDRVHWVEIDLPAVRALWFRFLVESDRHRFWEYSVMDLAWVNALVRYAQGRVVLFIVEGVFMYFSGAEVRQVVLAMQRAFPGSDLLLDTIGPFLTSHTGFNPAIAKLGAQFRWGVRNPRELETWNEGIKLIEEWNLLDYHQDRWGWMRYLRRVPAVRRQLMVGHLRLE
jgi:O-methyltransferase involved in polyketide biosynthesis